MSFISLPKPILVSGCSRSGTTWVGRTLALSKKTKYLYEPFNIDMKPSLLAFPHQFMYVCPENEVQHIDQIQHWLDRQTRCNGIKQFFTQRPAVLLKDPLAFFSAPWLAKTFECRVVITIRHPAAIASSREKLGWRFNFSHFLDQSLLMHHHLAPFKPELEKIIMEDHDVIDESILLWKIIYSVVKQYRIEHPDWYFVRHEDLCKEPISQFKFMFEHLKLNYSSTIQAKILDTTSPTNPIEPTSATQHNLIRNSSELSKIWKDRLSRRQVERIRLGVGSLSDEFYSRDEW